MKSWWISNFNEKTITVKTGAIFKTHLLCSSSKFLFHEVSRKKESQWYSQETVTQNFKSGTLIFLWGDISIYDLILR